MEVPRRLSSAFKPPGEADVIDRNEVEQRSAGTDIGCMSFRALVVADVLGPAVCNSDSLLGIGMGALALKDELDDVFVAAVESAG